MTICFYHDDLDGKCSAAIVNKYVQNCEFYKVQYNEYEFEQILEKATGQDVYLVDFSFLFHEMEKLLEITKKYNTKFIWIDHHVTAKEKLKKFFDTENIAGIRSLETSACALTWEYFAKDELMPDVVRFIADWDCWKFEYGEITKEINEYFNAVDNLPYFDIWKKTLSPAADINEFRSAGQLLLHAKNKRVFTSIKYCEIKKLKGVGKCIIYNTPHDISDIGNFLVKSGDYKCAVVYRCLKGDVVVSMRGDFKTTGFKCNEFAEKFGGGGHVDSAGFQMSDWSEFEKLFEG